MHGLRHTSSSRPGTNEASVLEEGAHPPTALLVMTSCSAQQCSGKQGLLSIEKL